MGLLPMAASAKQRNASLPEFIFFEEVIHLVDQTDPLNDPHYKECTDQLIDYKWSIDFNCLIPDDAPCQRKSI
jgi:hypothetical protein